MWYAAAMKLHGGNTTEVQAIIDAAPRGDVPEGNLRRLQALGGTDAMLAALLAAPRRIEQLEAKLNGRKTPDPVCGSAFPYRCSHSGW